MLPKTQQCFSIIVELIAHHNAETCWQGPLLLSNVPDTAALLVYLIQPSVPVWKTKKQYLGGKPLETNKKLWEGKKLSLPMNRRYLYPKANRRENS